MTNDDQQLILTCINALSDEVRKGNDRLSAIEARLSDLKVLQGDVTGLVQDNNAAWLVVKERKEHAARIEAQLADIGRSMSAFHAIRAAITDRVHMKARQKKCVRKVTKR